MKTTHKLRTGLQPITLLGLCIAMLALVFGININSAQAAPFEIMYSYDWDHDPKWPLEGAEITDDVYVFIDDPAHEITNVKFSRNGWYGNNSFDLSRSAIDTFDFYESRDYELHYSEMGNTDRGGAVAAIVKTNAGPEYEIIAHYDNKYGQKYDAHAISIGSNFKPTVFDKGNQPIVGGTINLGQEWYFRVFDEPSLRDATPGNIWAGAKNVGPGAETLKDVITGVKSRAGGNYSYLASGSFVDGSIVRPVMESYDSNTGAWHWRYRDFGTTDIGSMNNIIFGLTDAHDTSDTWDGVEKSIWISGYERTAMANPAYWVIQRSHNNLSAAPTADWKEIEPAVIGEPLAMTKDGDYLYVAGYVENGGKDYWRLEKRELDTGALVDSIDYNDGFSVEGKIYDLSVQLGQEVEAIWAGGYEINSSTGEEEWRLQKFTFSGGGNNGNLVASSFAKPGLVGAIKSVSVDWEVVNAGGSYLSAVGDYDLRSAEFDKNANGPVNMLDENLSSDADEFIGMQLPFVAGWNQGTGEIYLQSVKSRGSQAPVIAAICDPTGASSKAEKFVINHTGRSGLLTWDGDDMTDPVRIYSGMTPVVPVSNLTQNDAGFVGTLPAGRYDVTQVTSDGGHTYYIQSYEQTQDQEGIATYFIGANAGEFKASAVSTDIPNDANYKVSYESSLDIPFDVFSVTAAHPIYDQDDGGSTAANWDNKGILSFPYPPNPHWRSGGSVGPECTVLDRYPQCNDGIDNDGDGLIDHAGGPLGEALDDGCDDANDDSEDNDLIDCSLTVPVGGYLVEYTSLDPVTNKYSIISDTIIDRARLTPKPLDIAAGNYKVTLEYYDPAHPLDTTQTREQWKVQLLDGSNPDTSTVLAESGVTPDLPDATARDFSVVNSSLVVPSGVTHIMPVNDAYPSYASDGIGDNTNPNSIRPRCAAFEPVAAPPPGSCSLQQGNNRELGQYKYVIPISEDLPKPGGIMEAPPTGIGYEIPAGLYEVTLEAFDGWPGRSAGPSQDYEVWKAAFAHSGVIIDTSSSSIDVGDEDFASTVTRTNSWDSVNEPPLNLTSPANQIIAQHAYPADANSVTAVCVGINPVPSCPFVEDVASDYYVIDFSPTSYTYGESADNVVYGGSYPKYRQIPHDADLGDGVVGSGIDAIDKNIPSGKYNITLLGYDGYLGRSAAVDSFESWNVKLNNTTLLRGVTTPTTTELKDGVEFASSSDTFLGFDIPYDMDKIRAYHGNDGGAMGSVRPICVAFEDTGLPSDNNCQLIPKSAGGTYDYVVEFNSPSIGSEVNGVANTETSYVTVPGGIPTGFYDIELQTYDAHNGSDNQNNEQWYAVLDNPDPLESYHDTTNETPDLPANKNTEHWNVETKKQISTTTRIKAKHYTYNNIGDDSNSLIPVCIGIGISPMPNLIIEAGPLLQVPSDDPVAGSWDPTTGYYYSVPIRYILKNDGDDGTGSGFDNELYYNFVGSIKTMLEPGEVSTESALGPGSDTGWITKTLSDVTPGDYTVRVTADTAITGDSWHDVYESNENDNMREVTDFIKAPDPQISLSINPGIARVGETADLDWSTNGVTYPMDCEIIGQGQTIASFNPNDPDPNTDGDNDPSTGTVQTLPLNSKSEFLFRCTERISGHDEVLPTATAIVEVVGMSQEI